MKKTQPSDVLYHLGRGAGFVQRFAWLGESCSKPSVTRMATLSPLRVRSAMI
jgi:hypothetical protein